MHSHIGFKDAPYRYSLNSQINIFCIVLFLSVTSKQDNIFSPHTAKAINHHV